MENAYPPQQEPGLFDDVQYHLVQAGHGQRLANYIIDLVSFYVAFFLISFIIILINPAIADNIPDDDGGFAFGERLISLLLYGMYLGIVEALFRGRSLGKLITGTKVVNEDGTAISAQTALLRGLCRAVPFNAFSALGTPCFPWHDRWTKSCVVDIKASNLVE